MRSVVALSVVVLTLCLSRFAAACINNSECPSVTPYCSNQTCVACLANAHCSSSTPHCTNQGTCTASPSCGCTSYTNSPVCKSTKCVQCSNNTECASGVCDTTLNVCRPPVTCTNSNVCAGTDRPICAGDKCVECRSNSDCSTAFPTCTAAGVCSAQKLTPVLMCSKDVSPGVRTLYTAFLTSENVDLVVPVGSRNALYVSGQNMLLNAKERFRLNGTRSHFYPQSFEALDISAVDVDVTWYLDGSFVTLALNSSSECPTGISFFLSVANITFAAENESNITDVIVDALGVTAADVSIDFNVNKRSVQQSAGLFQVTIGNGFDAVLAFLNAPTTLTAALSAIGVVVDQVQGVALTTEPVPVFDTAAPVAPVASPTVAPVAGPVATPTASPNVVPTTPVTTFPPSSSITPDGNVATPGALDSGIIVAIVVVCVVVAAAVIIIAVVVSRNKKKKSGGGNSSRMERGSATELKETGSTALVATANPSKKEKVESESSDEDEESGEDEDSDEESEEEESGSEVSGSEASGSGSNEGSSSAEGSGSKEGSSASGSEESS